MAAAPRNRLPSGHDEEFVNAVDDDFQCLICHLPLKEPVLTRCGHRCCKECLEEHFRRQRVQNQPSTCPADREGLDEDWDVFPDKATERKILSLAIKCPSEGCKWTDELRNKEVHLASCLFKFISCTNENCHVTVQRRNLNTHVTITCPWRILECEHCNEPHPECQMQDHFAQCNKFPVCCPNNCGGSFRREMIPNHIKDDCSRTLIPCPYVKMGCEAKVQRKELESHLQSVMRLHLDLACVKLNDTEAKLNDTEARLNDTEEKLETRIFIWKINIFGIRLRQATLGELNNAFAVESDAFYTARTGSHGYKLKVKMYPNGRGSGRNTHLSVYIVLMKGEYDAILPWPFKKKITLTLIDQQGDLDERENVSMLVIPGMIPECFARPMGLENTMRGFGQFISHEKLNSRRYIVDDTLFIQIEVGP